jgi:hypothetical protein
MLHLRKQLHVKRIVEVVCTLELDARRGTVSGNSKHGQLLELCGRDTQARAHPFRSGVYARWQGGVGHIYRVILLLTCDQDNHRLLSLTF